MQHVFVLHIILKIESQWFKIFGCKVKPTNFKKVPSISKYSGYQRTHSDAHTCSNVLLPISLAEQ